MTGYFYIPLYSDFHVMDVEANHAEYWCLMPCFYVFSCMFMTDDFDDLYIYYIYFTFIHFWLFFDRCAYRGLSFWVRFYNIIIHYIILYILYYPMLSLTHFCGRCMWDFCGMCYQSDDRHPILHQITHMSAVFVCVCLISLISLLFLCVFDVLMEEYICICPFVSISYEDSSASFQIL